MFTLPIDAHEVTQRSGFDSSASRFELPTFDHKQKDPVFDAIEVPAGSRHIFVEGIYTFDQSMGLDGLWDLKVWVDASVDVAVERMARRHLQA